MYCLSVAFMYVISLVYITPFTSYFTSVRHDDYPPHQVLGLLLILLAHAAGYLLCIPAPVRLGAAWPVVLLIASIAACVSLIPIAGFFQGCFTLMAVSFITFLITAAYPLMAGWKATPPALVLLVSSQKRDRD